MATYKEIGYMCLDQVKINSDDSYIELEHAIFLALKYRALLLKQRYGDIRKDVPISNYQTICINLESTTDIDSHPCDETYLRTTEPIPNIMGIGAPRVHSVDFFTGNIYLISFDRFRYVGHNRYLKNVIYSTLAPDRRLYIKSANPQFIHLESIRVSGIFSDPIEAFNLRCDQDTDDECDVLDTEFPLESPLIPVVIQMVVKDLLGAAYRPQDNKNNSSDDLSDLANFLMNITNRGFQRQINGEDS